MPPTDAQLERLASVLCNRDYNRGYNNALFEDMGQIPAPLPETMICAGGCQRELPSSELRNIGHGRMCENCISDLYVECADCGCTLHYDEWGECDDLRIGPDDVYRCIPCDRATFAICTYCGRHARRSDGNVRVDPDNPEREYCQGCWDNIWCECPVCSEILRAQDGFFAPGQRRRLCEDCFNQDYFRCSACGDSFSRSDIMGWDGDPFCEGCYGRADVWKVQPWSGEATTFDKVGSERRYGVELETRSCDEHTTLHGKTEWGCVYECSTPGREMVSPILQGDEGFAEIREMCDIAASKRWTVDRSCGLHAHFDARDLSSDQLLRIAYAYRKTYSLWKKFVNGDRAGNSMCGSPQYTTDDIRAAEHIEDFVEPRDRFEFVNWRAYIRHGSIEVRIYQGTLKAREICNWVKLHLAFIDAVKEWTFDELDEILGGIARKNWAGLVDLIDDTDLLDYWRRKAARQGNDFPAIWAGETEAKSKPKVKKPKAELRERRLVVPSGHCGAEHCDDCNREFGRMYYA